MIILLIHNHVVSFSQILQFQCKIQLFYPEQVLV